VNVVSGGNVPWVLSSGDPTATLEILLQRQTLILSWLQFVCSEGNSEELRIAFASHDVVIRGAGLDELLSAIASHRVLSLRASLRSERFSAQAGRFIHESSSEGSKVSYEANARNRCFEVAIELG
jgi:hypothetical protein